MSGIYIHIPFCKQACHYCNFHFSTSLKYRERMIKAMVSELKSRKDYLEDAVISSIYLGGGTPSLLNEHEINILFDQLFSLFTIQENAEITLEANPDDLDKNKIKILESSPINRLSIGIQSFNDEFLKWMNRAHNTAEAEYCLEAVRDSNFESISLDLIFGIPGSNLKLWESDLIKALEFHPEHISVYGLTVETGTALNHFVKHKTVIMPQDEKIVEQFDFAKAFLENKGYTHYEISNYALQDFEAVHNSNYWKSVSYLGIGPSAHSYNGNSRSYNIANNQKYMKALEGEGEYKEAETLSLMTRYNEYVMTRLRTIWGINTAEIPSSLSDYFSKKIEILTKKGWVQVNENKIILTHEGLHFADAAAMELFYVA